jgi:hypothetical protein
MDNINLNPGEPDHLVWRLSSFGHYSASSAYSAMFLNQSSVLGAKDVWKIWAPRK